MLHQGRAQKRKAAQGRGQAQEIFAISAKEGE